MYSSKSCREDGTGPKKEDEVSRTHTKKGTWSKENCGSVGT